MRKTLFACALVLAFAMPELAAAQSSDAALAETLYQQGRTLMDQKKYDEACPKFAESHRLEPATGTLLNLASCNEARGKLATAWSQFNDAVIAARRDQREDRVQFARERIAAIEPKLSRITINVPAATDVEGLEVRMDGVLIGKAAWGVPVPTDRGKHKLEVMAPNKQPWSESIDIAEAEQKTVLIPALADAPKAPETTEDPARLPTTTPTDRGVTERPIPTSVWIAGGATVLLAAGAGVSGLLYVDKKGKYDDLNGDPASTVKARDDAKDEANTWGIANGVLTIATVAGAATTIYLYVTRPEVKRTSRPRPLVTPWVSGHAGGVVVSGSLF
jgi:hypothetical protein